MIPESDAGNRFQEAIHAPLPQVMRGFSGIPQRRFQLPGARVTASRGQSGAPGLRSGPVSLRTTPCPPAQDAGKRAIFLRPNPPDCGRNCANPQILGRIRRAQKKCHLSRKKLLRTPAPIRKYPFTEAAATLKRQTEAAETPGSRNKNEKRSGGCAKQVWRFRLILSLTLFEIAGY